MHNNNTDHLDSDRSSDDDDVDFTKDASLYQQTLQKQLLHSNDIRKQDIEQEKTLLEFLPVNEKFNMNKEGKVLAKWQERQKDWENIQKNISRNIHNKKYKRPLMMSTTDEYRAKLEEYDLIQAAMPEKDRYADVNWQMSLRGGGPITVNVGHMFSGLECEIEQHFTKPKLFRKPKLQHLVGRTGTVMELTSSLVARKTKYERQIKEIRPVDINFNEAINLAVESQDLFTWAKESSDRYFEQQKGFTSSAVHDHDHGLKNLSRGSSRSSLEESDDLKIEMLTSPEVCFVSRPQEMVLKTVSFRNVGLISISYRWIHNSKKDLKSTNKLGDVLDSKFGSKELRKRALNSARESFHCLNQSGTILPNEKVSTTFLFFSRIDDGSLVDSWTLEFTPRANIYFRFNGTNQKIQKGSPPGEAKRDFVGNAILPDAIGFYQLTLRGHCNLLDETVSRKHNILLHVERKVVDSMVGDIIQSCIRRVRTPVRMENLKDRQIKLFYEINKENFLKLSPQFTSLLPLFITNERVDALSLVSATVSEFYQNAIQMQNSSVNEWKTLLESYESTSPSLTLLMTDDIRNKLKGLSQEVYENLLDLNDQSRLQLVQRLFPEESLDVFDEVTFEDIVPSWKFDMSLIVKTLEKTLVIGDDVAIFEDLILKGKAILTKDEMKRKKMELKKLKEDDDEDEEVEEDEEDVDEDVDGEEGAIPVKPLNIIQSKSNNLMGLLNGLTHSFTLKSIPRDEVYKVTADSLVSALNQFEMIQQGCIERAEISEVFQSGGKVPTLPSPFLTTEGSDAWRKALAATSPNPEPIAGKKAAKPPAKPAGGKNAPLIKEATPEQSDYYYKELYHDIHEILLKVAETVAEQMDSKFLAELSSDIEKYEMSSTDFFNIASILQSDIGGSGPLKETATVGFIGFNGDAFVKPKQFTAFKDSLIEKEQLDAVEPVIKLLEYQAKAIVLIYESYDHSTGDTKNSIIRKSHTEMIQTVDHSQGIDPTIYMAERFHEDVSLIAKVGEIEAMVTKEYSEYQMSNDKLRRKTKQGKVEYKKFVIVPVLSFAELNYKMTNYLRSGEFFDNFTDPQMAVKKGKHSNIIDGIPIFILENISRPGVVPEEPIMEDNPDDDEESAPVNVGKNESKQIRIRKWIHKRPHRVKVKLDLKEEVMELANKNSNSKNKSNNQFVKKIKNRQIEVQCYADAAAAIMEIYTIASKSSHASESINYDSLWIDGVSPSHLYQDHTRSAFLQLHKLITNRYLSNALRENFVWNDIIQQMALTQWPLHSTSNEVADASSFLKRLFPRCIEQQIRPKITFVLGGAMRSDKLRVLDQMLYYVDQVILVGEFAIPFISVRSSQIKFQKHEKFCADLKTACENTIYKARLHGVALQLPLDVVYGDESITNEERQRCHFQFDPESRNEGVEYEGETKQVSFSSTDLTQQTIQGYVYDVGSETASSMKSWLASTDLVVVWGTVGVCEYSGFQAGQLSLIAATSVKHDADVSLKNARSIRTMLIGDSAVEWYTRVLDSDGEIKGKIVEANCVDYVVRDSTIHCGLFGMYPHSTIQHDTLRRNMIEEEWQPFINPVRLNTGNGEDENEEEEED